MNNENINKKDLIAWMRETEALYAQRPNKKITVRLDGIFYIYQRVNNEWNRVGATVNIDHAISEFNNLKS